MLTAEQQEQLDNALRSRGNSVEENNGSNGGNKQQGDVLSSSPTRRVRGVCGGRGRGKRVQQSLQLKDELVPTKLYKGKAKRSTGHIYTHTHTHTHAHAYLKPS